MPSATRLRSARTLRRVWIAAIVVLGCEDTSAPTQPESPSVPPRPTPPLTGPVRTMPRLHVRVDSDSEGAAIAGERSYLPRLRVIDDGGAPVARVDVSFALPDGRGELETA